MNIFLILLLIAAMGATLFMLIKGIVTFLKTTEEDLKSGPNGPSSSGLKQNKAMMGRIIGRETLKNVDHQEAPSSLAASSTSLSCP